MLIRYPEAEPAAPRSAVPERPRTAPVPGRVGVGFVGAGAFARGVLLPAFARRGDVALTRVATAHGLTAYDAQRKFGFSAIGTDAAEVLGDPAVQLVCIATRHDGHAALVSQALAAGKHVFVEKPLALDETQLAGVEAALATAPGLLLVGFNRRFAPMARAVRTAVAGRGPLAMLCRVNAGALPAGHWLNDPAVGGGRAIGEGCHFVDLMSFMTGDAPIASVRARTLGRPREVAEDFAIELSFEDGSVGQILYTARGAAGLGKERMEVHAGGVSAVIDDFRKGTIWRGGRRTDAGPAGKGHAEEIAALIDAVRAGGPAPIPAERLLAVTRATFAVHRDVVR
jgi:predicted dehydrogenase